MQLQYAIIYHTHRTVQYSTVQYCVGQYNTVEYSTASDSKYSWGAVLYRTDNIYSTVLHSTVQYSQSTVLHSTVHVQYSTVLYQGITRVHSTVQYCIVQYSRVQY